MARTYPYTPILGWSATRYGTFQTCKRRYYYQYYAKHDPEYPRHKIDYLKDMITVPLARGRIAHDMIKSILRRLQQSGEQINTEWFLEQARRAAKYYCNRHVFAEVYYGEIEEPDPDAISEVVVPSLVNWLGSKRFRWIRCKALRRKDDWIVEPPGYGETRIDGLKAYLVIDFLSPTEDGIVIIDWKTGGRNEDKYRKQLDGYACWASLEFDTDPAQIEAAIAYLSPYYDEVTLNASDIDVGHFLGRFKSETEEMYGFCSDIERNIPREKSVFAQTNRRVLCGGCNFRELCQDGV